MAITNRDIAASVPLIASKLALIAVWMRWSGGWSITSHVSSSADQCSRLWDSHVPP
jgi:hypothetical protein